MFLYCHPDMNIKEDVVYRVNWCKNNKVLPYLMRDQSCWQSENRDFYIDLCAYCNQVSLFKKMTFDDFMQKRTNNIERRNKSIKLYGGDLKNNIVSQNNTQANSTSLSLNKGLMENQK